MENTKKDTFIAKLAAFQEYEQEFNSHKETSDILKSDLKSAGVILADSLYEAIISKDIDADFLENLPKVSRTCQGYLSKARKVGFAVLSGDFIRPADMSLTRAYDVMQEAKNVHKEANKLLSQRAARENAALLEVMGSQAEVNRVLTENGPELQAALQTGLAIIAEKEAKNLAEEKARDMEKLVTETKASLAIIMETDYWPEIFAYVMDNSHMHAKTRNMHVSHNAA